MPPLRARYFFEEAFPKFGRMDPLCKLAVAATQLIKKAGGFDGLNLDEVAQVGGTTAGCLEADALFEASRRAGLPSPALFVYTLPSMFQGEIAIHFRLRGRCVLYSGGGVSAEQAQEVAARLVDKRRAPAALAMAADAANGRAEAAAWLVRAE
jgi:3-oxoacyl-(acyl-carrier-protein) synthase